MGEAEAGGPGKMVAGRLGGPTSVCGETGRNNWGMKETMQTRVPVQENKASKPLTEKNLWELRWQEKLPDSQENSLERPTGS